MKWYSSSVMHHNGEGVMLRKPNSLYEAGKSHSLLKIKAFIDTEAIVVEKHAKYCLCKLYVMAGHMWCYLLICYYLSL